jgi:hypothetical protein
VEDSERGRAMKSIKFQHNWNNKLGCDYFTTIRRFTPDKLEYYKTAVDDEFDVLLNGVSKGHAKLMGWRKSILSDIAPELLICDTGSPKAFDVFRKFGLTLSSEVLVLLFKNIKRDDEKS